ncbi:MAG: hypothetical protein GY830_08745 [Bacteroidetes bacterium]|nr:hypothetical protein [Bacteroidota bacterium]
MKFKNICYLLLILLFCCNIKSNKESSEKNKILKGDNSSHNRKRNLNSENNKSKNFHEKDEEVLTDQDINLIHTGIYNRKLERVSDYDPQKLDFDNWDLLEYDAPSDGNCWVWSFIPLFLSQVLFDDKKYKDFINKVKTFQEYLNKYAFGIKLTKEEEDICMETIKILEKIKNKEGILKELDKNQILVKFVRKISNVLIDAWILIQWAAEFNFIENYLKDTIFEEVARAWKIHAFLEKRKYINEMEEKIEKFQESIEKRYSDQPKTIFEVNGRLDKFYDRIKKTEELRTLENSWGSPMYLRDFCSYFKILLLNIHSNSSMYGIKNGKLLGEPESAFEGSWEEYFKNMNTPKIFMRYINGNHYRYVIVKKKNSN